MKQKTKTTLYLILFATFPLWVSIIFALLLQEPVLLWFSIFSFVTILMALIDSYRLAKGQKGSPEKKTGMSKGFKIILILVVLLFIFLMVLNTYFGLPWVLALFY